MSKQFPPIDPATIGKVMKDGRAYTRRSIIAERLSGPARHEVIGPRIGFNPPISLWQFAVCALVAGFIGFIMATGGVL